MPELPVWNLDVEYMAWIWLFYSVTNKNKHLNPENVSHKDVIFPSLLTCSVFLLLSVSLCQERMAYVSINHRTEFRNRSSFFFPLQRFFDTDFNRNFP